MFVFVRICVFNMWPKTTLLLPGWPSDAKRLDTPGLDPLDDQLITATAHNWTYVYGSVRAKLSSILIVW